MANAQLDIGNIHSRSAGTAWGLSPGTAWGQSPNVLRFGETPRPTLRRAGVRGQSPSSPRLSPQRGKGILLFLASEKHLLLLFIRPTAAEYHTRLHNWTQTDFGTKSANADFVPKSRPVNHHSNTSRADIEFIFARVVG